MSSNQELLQSVPLFSDLPGAAIDRLGKIAIDRDFAPGSQIVEEGERGVAFFIITSGRVEVSHGHDGKAFSTLKAGDFFGEIALIENAQRTATVKAVEPTHCLAISQWDFLSEVRANPDLAIHLLQTLARRLRSAEQRAEVAR